MWINWFYLSDKIITLIVKNKNISQFYPMRFQIEVFLLNFHDGLIRSKSIIFINGIRDIVFKSVIRLHIAISCTD